ncbi:hypothetical protein [Paenibacillus polymyxa]|uniref:hypothetical protein n=1 Tax=Paenibacillus polymyxa TaxID=1406 RepID=UPI0032176552
MNKKCKLCANYNPLEESCVLQANSFDFTSKNCAYFIRYMNLLPQIKSFNRRTLTVVTKRGIERAIPAYPELDLSLRCNSKGEVESIFTYQGQRELIHDYGLRVATEIANNKGIRLYVLPEEEYKENTKEKYGCKQGEQPLKNLYWMSEYPIEVWT